MSNMFSPFRICALFAICLLSTPGHAQTSTVVSVNFDHVLVINGKKVFPIGFSPGPPTRAKTPAGKDALQEFREAGALLFRISQTGNWNSQLVAEQQAALDWAQEYDMYGWVNLRELSKFPAGDTATETALRNMVNTFKNHPAMGLWKNFDEAWWGDVSAEDLKRGYDVIKQEDPNHPVVQTHAPRGTVADLQPYNAATDILALDIYPIGYPPGTHSLLPNKEISMVGDWAQFLNQVGQGQKQFWMIEQIGWSGVLPPAKTLRFPTFHESRFMAYQAIINGARGLMFFGGNITSTLAPEDLSLGYNWTFWDNVLKRVVKELGDKSLLADALVAPASTLPISLAVSNGIEFTAREAPPYLYILACKREGAVTNVTFNGLPGWASTGDVLYESPRKVTAANGSFTDWFAPFEVHVYRFLNPGAGTNQLLAYEPFAYTNIGGPVNANTPGNWTTGGAAPNDCNVAQGSLSYPGLPASIGNSITNGGAGFGVRRLFGTAISNNTLYVSALFRMNQLGYGAWSGASTLVGALTAPDNTTFRLQILVRSNSPSGYVVGLQKASGGATVWDTSEYHAGDTLLLAAKYDFTVSPNRVTLWINPSSSTFGSTTAPTTNLLSTSSGTDGFVIDRFNFRQNTTQSVPAAMQWDELRVGLNWADVAPRPSSQSTMLTNVTELEDGSFQFSYTANSAHDSTVYASTNLTHWSPLGAAQEISPGLYRFIDHGNSNHSRRFYQLRWP